MAEINDFISKKAEKQIDGYLKSLGLIVDTYDDIAKQEAKAAENFSKKFTQSKKLEGQINRQAKSTETLTNKQKWLNTLAKESEKINKGLATTSAKLTASYSKENVRLQQKRKELREVNKTIRFQNILNDKLSGTLEKLAAKNALLRKEVRGLDLTTRKGIATSKKLNKQIDKNDKTINQYSDTLKRRKLNIGNYSSALEGLGGRFSSIIPAIRSAGVAMKTLFLNPIGLVIAAIAAFGALVVTAVSNSKDFGKALSSLSAITGATGDTLAFFSRKAKEMSQGSLLAADEILTAFEKVGSIRPELLKDAEALAEVTQQAIILSEATGGSLSLEDAAKSLTFVMNQLNIETKDAAKTTDVLAAGQKFGSATIADMAETFKNAGAIFKDSNLTLQESVAITQAVSEKQLVGAEAGTKLRSSIINLKNAGLGYAEGQFDINNALDEAKVKYDSLGTAVEKDQFLIKTFGKLNISTGTILLNSTQKIKDLTKAVDENGVALEQQKRQNDNLSAELKKTKNSWSNLLLTISDGTGIWTEFAKSGLKAVQLRLNLLAGNIIRLSAAWKAFTRFLKGEDFSDAYDEEIDAIKKRKKAKQEDQEEEEKQREDSKKADEDAVKQARVTEQGKQAAIEKSKQARLDAANEVKAIEKAKTDEIVKQIKREQKEKENTLKTKREEDKGNKKLLTTDVERDYYNDLFALRNESFDKQIELLNKESEVIGTKESEKIAIQTKVNDIIQSKSDLKTQHIIDNSKRESSAIKKASDKEIEDTAKTTKAVISKRLSDAEILAKAEDNIARTRVAKGLDTQEEYEQNKIELQTAGLNTSLLNLQSEIDKLKDGTAEKIALEQKYNEIKQELSNQSTDNEIANLEKEAERRKELQKLIIDTTFEAAQLVTDAYFDAQQTQLDNELATEQQKTAQEIEELDKRKEAGLITETAYNVQKEKLSEDLAKKEGAIKTKQAKNDKKQALFGILISTAKGIVEALPNIPLSIAVGVIGALQAGIVASKPIPQFAKGTKSSPDTFIAGEKGRELMMRGNEVMMAEKPTLYTGMKGTTVISNKQTERMLSNAGTDEHRDDYNARNRILNKIASNTKPKRQKAIRRRITERIGHENYYAKINE